MRLLRRNLARNGARGVRVRRAAASRTDGAAVLGLSELNAGDHRLGSASRAGGLTVRTLRLDGLRIPQGGPLVLKLDIQGSEVAALSGAAGLLQAARTVRVLAEFWPHGLADCDSSADALIALLGTAFRPLLDRLVALRAAAHHAGRAPPRGGDEPGAADGDVRRRRSPARGRPGRDSGDGASVRVRLILDTGASGSHLLTHVPDHGPPGARSLHPAAPSRPRRPPTASACSRTTSRPATSRPRSASW